MDGPDREAHPARDLEPVEARQPDVDERDVGPQTEGRLKPGGAVHGLVHLVAGQLEHEPQHLTRVGIVLHDEDPARGAVAVGARPGRQPGGRRHRGQAHGKLAAAPLSVAPRLDAAPVQLGDAAHQREPEAEAARAAVGAALALHEEVEHAGQHFRRDTDPRVADTQHGQPVRGAQRDLDLSPRRREPERIAHQVADDLLEARLVHVGPHRIERDGELVVLGAPARGERRDALPHRLRQLHGTALERDLARGDRATSRRSSTRWARWAFWRAMISRARRAVSGGALGMPSTATAFAMADSGLRSS